MYIYAACNRFHKCNLVTFSRVIYTVLSNLNQLKLLLYFLLKFFLCLSNLSKNILFYSPL